jgi:hypothetical protein
LKNSTATRQSKQTSACDEIIRVILPSGVKPKEVRIGAKARLPRSRRSRKIPTGIYEKLLFIAKL